MSDHTKQFLDLDSYNSAESRFLTPFQRKVLLKNLQNNLKPEYRHRLEIMLLADVGKSQTEICQIVGCSHHVARYWISVAKAGLAHQWQEQPRGRPKIVNEQYLQRLKELVSHSPYDYGYGFHSWTAQWLSKHLASEFDIQISARHVNRLLKEMGLSTKSKRVNVRQTSTANKDFGITISDLKSPSESSFQRSLRLLQLYSRIEVSSRSIKESFKDRRLL